MRIVYEKRENENGMKVPVCYNENQRSRVRMLIRRIVRMQSADREILLEISGRLMRIERRQDSADQRLSAIESRMDKIESRMEVIVNGLIQMDKRQSVMEGKFDVMLWAIALGFVLLSVLVTYMVLRQPKEKPEGKIQPVIIPSQPTITLEAVERIVSMTRNHDSSKPMNDTSPSPDSTPSS